MTEILVILGCAVGFALMGLATRGQAHHDHAHHGHDHGHSHDEHEDENSECGGCSLSCKTTEPCDV